MHSLSKIQQSFQRALQSYNDNASFQQNIASRLVDLAMNTGLPSNAARSLEIGCGTGFLTKQLVNHVTSRKWFINDLVANCETYIQDLIPTTTRWQFLTGNIEKIHIPEQLDLISSASTLQWVTDLHSLLNQLSQQLNNGGYLLISSFTDKHFTEIRSLQKRLQKQNQQKNINCPMNYWSESQWHSVLDKNYDVLLIETETQVAYFDSVKDLLMHLRLTGVNGNARQNWTQQKLSHFEQLYSQHFQENGQYKLSYNPIYVIAKKRQQDFNT